MSNRRRNSSSNSRPRYRASRPQGLTVNTNNPPQTNSWRSPGGTVRANSPGGTSYRQASPDGRNRDSCRRIAAGYQNPNHFHSNMLPHWERAALSPIPQRILNTHPGRLREQELRRYLSSPTRRFRATSPGRTRSTIIQGHNQGVLGHRTSAAQHWNTQGHRRSRSENQNYNRQTSTYHGIENRPWSNASGSITPRYLSPAPHRGSHPMYWNRQHPNFQGGPWHSWVRERNQRPRT